MRRSRVMLAGAVLAVLVALPCGAQQHVIDATAEPAFLYVASGTSGSVDGDQLTLNGVPSILYFSDRPARIAGHMTVRAFIDLWNEGPDSFAELPPNAVLSVVDTDNADNVVVELTGVRVQGDTLAFDFDIVRGETPQGTFGPASLFIDGCSLGPIYPCR